MSEIVTDKPDPDCYLCDGRGVVGGCWECRLVHAVGFRPEHQHTYSFCRCVNERTVEVDDDDTGMARLLSKNHRHSFTSFWWTFGKHGRQNVHVHECLDEDCGRVMIGDGKKCDGAGKSHHKETL